TLTENKHAQNCIRSCSSSGCAFRSARPPIRRPRCLAQHQRNSASLPPIAASYRTPRSFAAAGVAGISGGELGSGPDLIAASSPLPAPAPLGVGLAVLLGVGGGAVPGGVGNPVTMTAGA